MIEPKISHPEAESATPETAGKMLAFAREERDLSVEDIASNLNLGVGVIEALEGDQYDLLPGHTFVKGYLISYAVLLRLNPDAVIQQMALQPEIPDMTTPKNRRRLKRTVCKRVSKPTNKSGGLFFKSVLVIILLAGVSLFGLNQLSHLDTERLAVLLKLPIPVKAGNAANDTNEILLPTQNTEN